MYEESKEARGMTYTGLETYVQQAAFDQTLTRLYGAEGAEKAHSRCMEVMEEFYKTFDRPAEALFSAPGRTEETTPIIRRAAYWPLLLIWIFWRPWRLRRAGSSGCCLRDIP